MSNEVRAAQEELIEEFQFFDNWMDGSLSVSY